MEVFLRGEVDLTAQKLTGALLQFLPCEETDGPGEPEQEVDVAVSARFPPGYRTEDAKVLPTILGHERFEGRSTTADDLVNAQPARPTGPARRRLKGMVPVLRLAPRAEPHRGPTGSPHVPAPIAA